MPPNLRAATRSFLNGRNHYGDVLDGFNIVKVFQWPAAIREVTGPRHARR